MQIRIKSIMDKAVSKAAPYVLIFWKLIRDAKFKTKLYAYLLATVILCSAVIGSTSYLVMKKSLIEASQEAAISSMKKTGDRMDDRIREFQNASYSLVSMGQVVDILTEAEKKNDRWNYTLNNNAFNNAVYFYDMIYKNSDYAILESASGEIYLYNQQAGGNPISEAAAKSVLDKLRGEVTVTSPIKWIKLDGQTYFVRGAIQGRKNQKKEKIGLLILAVQEKFYDCGDDSDKFVNNANLIVANPEGQIYKNQEMALEDKDLEELVKYDEGRYYVYSINKKIRGEQFLIISLRTEKYQWNIFCFIPHHMILERANQAIFRILIVAFFLLGIGIICVNFVYRMYGKNLEILETGMRQYEMGNYSRLDSPACYDELGLLILQFNHMGLKINELNELTRLEQEEKLDLRYQLMEAQINPHFLYNTLGTLKWLAYEKEQEEIAKLADSIISLLRFTIKNVNKNIKLKEELAYLKNYIYIQQVRYDHAFQARFLVTEEAMEFVLAGVVLQPFVENSILHGLDNSRMDGEIRIYGEIVDGKLHLKISDNGIGMSEEELEALMHKIETAGEKKQRGFNGIGVSNILLRLQLIYKEEFQYWIESGKGKGTTITLIIPEEDYEDTGFDSRR